MMALSFIILLLILLFTGMPVAFALITVGALGIIFNSGFDILLSVISTTVFRSVNSFSFITIPLFILMAELISRSRIAEDLFDALRKWIGHLPGGIGVTTVFSSAGFGALSGSSLAATSIMSKIAIPQMIRVGYKDTFSAGLVASSTGTLAVMIPPSIPLIIYGIQTETSIGQLLIAGIVPGLLLALLLSIYVTVAALRSDRVIEKFTWKERFQSITYIWPIALLIIAVLLVIYTGIGTSTEAAAIGALGALIIGVLAKRLNGRLIVESLLITVRQTSMLFFIVVGAYLFSYFITMTRIGVYIVDTIEASNLSPITILLLVILLYLVLGCFLDLLSAMLLTLPVVLPLMMGLGYDPIWFGILVVLLLEIGLVTPPLGINLFITSSSSGVPIHKVFYGSAPFLLVIMLVVILIILFPQLVLFLPNSSF
ncbi:hypothetical protein BTR23_12515 [Alkalihalophilus pseudofirmus]|nr:hypothetical protein BTR23_12515 [Alkalihalophilus pseudofirmus]